MRHTEQEGAGGREEEVMLAGSGASCTACEHKSALPVWKAVRGSAISIGYKLVLCTEQHLKHEMLVSSALSSCTKNLNKKNNAKEFGLIESFILKDGWNKRLRQEGPEMY